MAGPLKNPMLLSPPTFFTNITFSTRFFKAVRQNDE
nr:MAG TPA: hypothetical protein [Caudoviricetes sp.]